MVESLTANGALFHSLVASPIKEFIVEFEEPDSISLPVVTPRVVLPSGNAFCLLTLIGNF